MVPSLVTAASLPDEKIALFRSLFRGRTDVYPRRFESRKTGRSGYAPACANEWAPGICQKPRIRCADCRHRSFLPLTDEVIRWHLSGRDAAGQPFVAGLYPLFADDTCELLAVDLDKDRWADDAAALVETSRRLDLPAVMERSRSGRGAHLWLFFEERVPAALARRLGSRLLTETMERRPDIGLDSYDRLFPNQDVLPQGGFGNLIALPLQKGPRGTGTACSSTFTSNRGQTSGPSLRGFGGSAARRSKVSCATPSARDEYLACGSLLLTRMTINRGVHGRLGGSSRRRLRGPFRRRSSWCWAIRSTSRARA